MADAMLLDSPLPDTEQEEQRQPEEILTGESIMPFRPSSNFFCLFGFLPEIFFYRSSKSRGSCGENWSRRVWRRHLWWGQIPLLLLQEMHKRIKLARENMSLVQKLLAVSNHVIEYLIFVDRVVKY